MAENSNGTARWQLWVSTAAAAFILLGAMATLYVQVNTAYTTANDLAGRVDRLSSQLAETRSQLNTVCADLKEVETQFKASDQVRNLMHVNDLRIQAMLWRKAYGVDYPVDMPYLPSIAQDQPTPCH